MTSIAAVAAARTATGIQSCRSARTTAAHTAIAFENARRTILHASPTLPEKNASSRGVSAGFGMSPGIPALAAVVALIASLDAEDVWAPRRAPTLLSLPPT